MFIAFLPAAAYATDEAGEIHTEDTADDGFPGWLIFVVAVGAVVLVVVIIVVSRQKK
jgi:hypothetical protein